MKCTSSFAKYLGVFLVSVLILSCESLLTSNSNEHIQQSVSSNVMDVGQPASGSMDQVLIEQYNSNSMPERHVSVIGDLIDDDIIETGGLLPVIVRLKIPFTPEGLLTENEIQQQRQNIQNIQKDLLDALSLIPVKEVKEYKYIPYIAMQVDEDGLALLKDSPLVANVVEDKPEPPSLTESIPLIEADQAWESGFTGEGYTIGILDTGIDLDHSFFSGRIVDQACFSSNVEQREAESLCPNGENKDYSNGSGGHFDQSIAGYDHGTHVAGIAAGRGSNFSGVAKQANIISVQIFTKFNNDKDCGFSGAPCVLSYVSDQMKALEWIYELRSAFDIAAANMSIAGGKSNKTCDNDPRKAAIDNLRSSYIATVAASGNSGYTSSLSRPACISTVISVGSTTNSDNHSSFSNSASFLKLLAPGSSIKSSIPGGGFANQSGTSASSAHTAGTWAVVRQARPSANVTEVLNILTDTGIPVTNDQNGITKPRIMVSKAVGNPQEAQFVYDDKLVNPWINTSWSASIDFSSIEKVFSGSRAIRVNQDAWGALSLRHESWTSTVGIKHKLVVFHMYPDQQDATLHLKLANDNGDSFPRVRYGTVGAGKWNRISVPMSDLNPDGHTVHRINIMESSGQQKTYHVDEFRITDNDPGPAPEPDPDVLAVYDESLSAPWVNASWNSSVDFSNTEQAHSGSHSIRVNQDAWGGLSMHSGSWDNPSDIQPGKYHKVEFALYASGKSATIDLQLENDNGASFPRVRYGTINPNSWKVVSVSLAELNPDGHTIHRLNILESSGQTKTYYVDKLSLN